MELREAKNAFILTKKAENVTSGTLKYYNERISYFVEFLENKNFRDIDKISETEIREFLILRNGSSKNIPTHGYYRGLNAFFSFLYTENLV